MAEVFPPTQRRALDTLGFGLLQFLCLPILIYQHIGCAATCYALYQAARSIHHGDSVTANRMFRHRLYAQSFTLVAMVAGSIYYKKDRTKRKEFEGVIAEKKAKEKNEAWIRELEARDREDKEWRVRMGKVTAAETKALEKGTAIGNERPGGILAVAKGLVSGDNKEKLNEGGDNESGGANGTKEEGPIVSAVKKEMVGAEKEMINGDEATETSKNQSSSTTS